MDATVYVLVVVLHTAAAACLMGSMITEPMLRSKIRQATAPAELRMWLAFERRTNAPHPALALVLLGTGIYLGTAGWWTSAWFAVAGLLWLANSALAIGVLDRRAHALAQLLGPTDVVVSERADAVRQAATWDWGVATMSTNDLASLYLMFAKPDATGAVITVLVMQAVAIGAVAFGRSGTRAPLTPSATAH